MRTLKPSEKKFEDHIEKYLNLIEYKSIDYKKYDRSLCLIKNVVLDFIKKTQKDSWKKLLEIYQEETENKIFNRISSEISRRGVIDVLHVVSTRPIVKIRTHHIINLI